MIQAFKMSAPKLPSTLVVTKKSLFVTGATLKGFELKAAGLDHLIARSIDLSEARLDHIELDEAKLIKLLANDTVFKHCGLANADCSEGSFIRVEFTDGRMTGWDANTAALEDVLFSGCKLDMANFRASKLNRVRFVSCILTEADFMGAELDGVVFEDCLLEKVAFSQCKMKNVDLRGSELIDLSGWQYLKGATIDPVQLTAAAPYLAAELGLKVEN